MNNTILLKSQRYWQCGPYRLIFRNTPLVMGILNITTDSFSDDGELCPNKIVDHAAQMVEEGVDILDLGAQSTRPGATPVSDQEEIDRLSPVLEKLHAAHIAVPLSIDTYYPSVMKEVIRLGASIINDIYALKHHSETLELFHDNQVGIVLAHTQGTPLTMQQNPFYEDVVVDVTDFLSERVHHLIGVGINKDRIVVDPGIGFGKTPEHNKALVRYLSVLIELGLPTLIGLSRKSLLGYITGRAVSERLPSSIAANLFAAQMGASILRVHDVAATVDALKVWSYLAEESLDS